MNTITLSSLPITNPGNFLASLGVVEIARDNIESVSISPSHCLVLHTLLSEEELVACIEQDFDFVKSGMLKGGPIRDVVWDVSNSYIRRLSETFSLPYVIATTGSKNVKKNELIPDNLSMDNILGMPLKHIDSALWGNPVLDADQAILASMSSTYSNRPKGSYAISGDYETRRTSYVLSYLILRGLPFLDTLPVGMQFIMPPCLVIKNGNRNAIIYPSWTGQISVNFLQTLLSCFNTEHLKELEGVNGYYKCRFFKNGDKYFPTESTFHPI